VTMEGAGRIDVDFTLAIHNRTGKYFIGRDLLDGLGDMIGRVYYGPMALANPPSGLFGRVLGRIQYLQTRSHVAASSLRLPRRRSPRRLLHLDPFTVGSVELRSGDVVLCHDIGPITHPELFEERVCVAYRAIYREIAAVGPHLVFVSHASKDAFHRAYPDASRDKSHVIYPAIHDRKSGPESAPLSMGSEPYLLTVGSIGARKNQLACVRAFAKSGLADRGYRYVLCGAQEPGFEEVVRIAADVEGVMLLPYVDDRELAWLYRHAHGFVLASKLEGFGMPVAEAILHGVIPIVTRGSVLHEVAGDAALLVDAENEAEIAAAMTRLVEMSRAEREQRVRSLRASIDRFTPQQFVWDWRGRLQDVLAEPVSMTRLQAVAG
jgi:glycosyltransferase involved in cell wall biosynthesis